jgi:hypothetical protein
MIADTRAGGITSQPPASDKAIQVSATDEPAAELTRHEEGLLLKTGPIDAGMVWPVLTPLTGALPRTARAAPACALMC